MISPAWEIGGEIGRLGRVVHPWSGHARLFAMLELTAFCDESETQHEVYCVAGYWGLGRHWQTFDDLWKAQLVDLALDEFHAVDCEQGQGEFAGRTDRVEARNSLIDITSGSMIHGVFAVLNLREWDEVADEVRELRPAASDPYYIVFQMACEAIARGISCFAPDERIALVFDDRPEHGKVAGLYHSLKHSQDPLFRFTANRLGSVTYADSKDHPGLQAADLLAYEARRYLSGVEWGINPKPERPEWRRLARRQPLFGWGVDRRSRDVLMDRMRAQWGAEAKVRSEALAAKKAARASASSRARTSSSAPRSPEPESPEETS